MGERYCFFSFNYFKIILNYRKVKIVQRTLLYPYLRLLLLTFHIFAHHCVCVCTLAVFPPKPFKSKLLVCCCYPQTGVLPVGAQHVCAVGVTALASHSIWVLVDQGQPPKQVTCCCPTCLHPNRVGFLSWCLFCFAFSVTLGTGVDTGRPTYWSVPLV